MAIILLGRSYDFELVVTNIATRHRKLVYVPPLKKSHHESSHLKYNNFFFWNRQ